MTFNCTINKYIKSIFSTKSIGKKILLVLTFILIIFIYSLWNISPFIGRNTTILQMYHSGLGNQFFQYSAAYAFAKKTNSKLYVMLSTDFVKDSNKSSKDRYFELYKFGIKENQIIYNTDLNKNFFKILNFFKKIKVFTVDQDNFFDFEKERDGLNLYYIKGYFQDIKYFKDVESEVKELFSVNDLKSSKTEALLGQLQQKNSVCIHVRLGDWKSTFGELDNDYYYEAIKLVKDKINSPQFFIFSDDISGSKQKFKDFEDFYYIDDKKLFPTDDFFLLASCSNVINSTSTFNWWSAFLNYNEEKLIIAPKDFNSNPDGWIGVEQFKIKAPVKKL